MRNRWPAHRMGRYYTRADGPRLLYCFRGLSCKFRVEERDRVCGMILALIDAQYSGNATARSMFYYSLLIISMRFCVHNGVRTLSSVILFSLVILEYLGRIQFIALSRDR